MFREKSLKKYMAVVCFCILSLFISVDTFAADVSTLSFSEQADNINVTVEFDTAGLRVISQGVIMAKTTGELTMETSGRNRITFALINSDGCCNFTVPATEEMKNMMFRAFLVTRGSDGKEKIFYSNQDTPAQYFEVNKEFVVDNIRYHKIENGFEVLGVAKQMSVITVPESVKGDAVVKVAERAFENDTVLTEISLPNTIQVIGKRAFAGCTSLKTMK